MKTGMSTDREALRVQSSPGQKWGLGAGAWCITQAAAPSMRRSCWPPGGISSVLATQDSQGPFPRGFLCSSCDCSSTAPTSKTSLQRACALTPLGQGQEEGKEVSLLSCSCPLPSLPLPGAHPASWRPCPGKGLSCPRLEAPRARPEEHRRELRWRGKPDSPSPVNLCLNPPSPSSFTSAPFHPLLACLCTQPRPIQLSSGFPFPMPPIPRLGLATCWPCGWDTLPALSEPQFPL